MATFLLMGPICTRRCRFCGISKGIPESLNKNEPEAIAGLVQELGLKHVVLTSVTRDDLHDGGASVFIRALKKIKSINRDCSVELLIPDFSGNTKPLMNLLDSCPDILSHNIETVRRLYPSIRPGFDYQLSLEILKTAKEYNEHTIVKSGIMVGLGENTDEVLKTIEDIRATGCDAITIGQYLRPSKSSAPVIRYYTPFEFSYFERFAKGLGFSWVASGPLVRSSYRSESLLRKRDEVN